MWPCLRRPAACGRACSGRCRPRWRSSPSNELNLVERCGHVTCCGLVTRVRTFSKMPAAAPEPITHTPSRTWLTMWPVCSTLSSPSPSRLPGRQEPPDTAVRQGQIDQPTTAPQKHRMDPHVNDIAETQGFWVPCGCATTARFQVSLNRDPGSVGWFLSARLVVDTRPCRRAGGSYARWRGGSRQAVQVAR
jgi:hypothetical protein